MKFRRKSGVESKISTSSMPDIIFMLLIFFMVTTVLREFSGLPVSLPRAERIEKLESKRHTSDIWVSKDGLISIEDKLYNAYYILADGYVANVIMKHHLPNQNVFDEKRIFDEGEISGPYQVGPIRIGSPICEDAWHSDVSETLSETGAQLLLVPNGSPYYSGKNDVRLNKMVSRVVETNLPLIYLNMVGINFYLMELKILINYF